ncbi:TetR/AcrR family transcriptional regulator [Paenibacillus sp. MBLB4367]|uniref:TetR/AcrR family transcriptional regulator n=1 Tax=Paenibacillus sp. MBLB4367 TaxID=3384767 RepID=UPI0039083185
MKKNPNAKSNRDQVVETAAQLFLTNGYTQTSMDEVMKRSQVSKSNIYYHFKSKEELLLGVVDWWAAQYESALFTLLGRTELTSKARIASFFEMLAEQFEARGGKGSCPFLSFYVQCPPDAEPVKERIARFFREQLPLVEKLLLQGVQKKEFRANLNAADTAAFILASLEGAIMLAETLQNGGIIRQSARSLCRLLEAA